MDLKKIFGDSRVGWGFALVFFGMLFFLRETGIVNEESAIFQVKNYPIYLGVIFLLTKNLRLSAVFFLIAALIHIGFLINAMKTYSDFVVPIILIVSGMALIFFSKK